MSMDSRTRRRAGVAGGAVLALTGAFVAGAALAGGGATPPVTGGGPTGSTGGSPEVPAVPIRLTGSGLMVAPTSDCDELLKVYVERGKELVGPWGWGEVYPGRVERGLRLDGMIEDSAGEDTAGATAPGSAPAMEGATSSDTGTNVQEAGVDEPDLVKTDGRLLHRIDGRRLTSYDVTGEEPVELGSLVLDEVDDPEILLAGDTIVAVGAERGSRWERPHTRVVRISVVDPTAPEVIEEQSWDTTLVTARQHGSTIRVVASAGLPDLDFVEPRRWRNERRTLTRNREIIERTDIDDWLPHVTTYDADGESTTERLVDCAEVSVPDSDSGVGTVAVIGFDAEGTGEVGRTGILAETDLVYASADRLYVATGPRFRPFPGIVLRDSPRVVEGFDPDGRTHVHAFALDGVRTSYVATGAVDGHLADRWSMDEQDGILRLALGPSWDTGNFNSVVTLREEGDRLVEIGRVDKLGVNEDIKSMRWFGEMAVMVTFRQVDPLYAIDLRNPEAPELLGELKIPGFSEYLHPLGPRRIIGIGQDADEWSGQPLGAQAAVFDLADVTDPIQASLVKYAPDTVAGAATDPRQFTWLPERRTALTVISEGRQGRTGWVSVLRLRNGQLDNEMVEVEHGRDVDGVRLVPLPGSADAPGKVVLVTGDGVSFLPLD